MIVAGLILGAVLYLLNSGDGPTSGDTAQEDMERLAGDAIAVLAALPVDDERYADRYLDLAVADALAGTTADLDGRIARMLPVAASYNVYLDNGHRTRALLDKGTPTGERVSTATPFVAEWSPAFTTTDFGVYSTAAGTEMRVTTWPVVRGRLIGDDALVPNADLEVGGSAPDGWVADAGATSTYAVEGADHVWTLSRATVGRVAYASDPLPVDSGTGLAVTAEIKGVKACVQVRYLDAAKAQIQVDGADTHCVASLAVASPGVWQSVSGTRWLGTDVDLAYVQVELAVEEAGEAVFDDIVVRPLAKADTGNGFDIPLTRSAASTYGGAVEAGASGYATALPETTSIPLETTLRHRGRLVSSQVAYRTSDSPVLAPAAVWSAAVTGLDASAFSGDATTVRPGGSVVFTYDFAALDAALAAQGVTIGSPQVVVRVYAPVVASDGSLVLVDTLAGTPGLLVGSVAFDQPREGLYGPHLVVASLEGDWTLGADTLADQSANKALVLDARLLDGSAATPPLYRVVLETWFREW